MKRFCYQLRSGLIITTEDKVVFNGPNDICNVKGIVVSSTGEALYVAIDIVFAKHDVICSWIKS